MKPTDNKCFDCGKGTLRRVVTSRTITVDGYRVRVPGLIALECDRCEARSWLDSEIQRAREVASLKRSAAA